MMNNDKYQDENKEEGGRDERDNGHASFNSLSKERKIAVVVLGVFALVIVFVWFFELKNNLDPLSRIKKESSSKINTDSIQQQEDSEDSLRNKDSDKDGLFDWDELYFYKTSPYLEDSDSDGFNDKNEVDSNNDPNCPTGRSCYSESGLDNASNGGQEQDLTQNIFGNLINGTGQQPQTAGNPLDTQDNIGSLRKMLLDSGFSREMLDQISDEDLLKAYQEAAKQQQ